MKNSTASAMKADDRFLKDTYNRYLIPTILAILGGTATIFFDSLLIGQKLGEDGLSAISLCMPIYLFLCAVGSLIAAGASLVTARKIGENHENEGSFVYNLAFIFSVICGLLITALGLLLLDPLTLLLCSDAALQPFVYAYLYWAIIGALPKMLLYISFFYLRLDGRSSIASFSMLLMLFFNIALDYIFLFKLEWGMGGVALASVLATCLACIVSYIKMQDRNSSFRLSRHHAEWSVVKEILRCGSPAAMNNLCMAIRILLINVLFLSVGGSPLVACFCIISSVNEFTLCVINGIPQTAAPIISIYKGERNNTAIRMLMHRQFRAGFILTGCLGAAIILCSDFLARAFGVADTNLFTPLLCLAISLIFAEANHIISSYFNSIGYIAYANVLTISRLLVLAVGSAWIFSVIGLPVWMFLPTAEILTFVIALVIMSAKAAKNKNLSRWLLYDDTLEKSGQVIDFSVDATEENICRVSEGISAFCTENDITAKQAMRISLALEEIMTVMAKECFPIGLGGFDVRAFSLSGTIGLSIKCAGKAFNPLSRAEQEAEGSLGDYMGITMIKNISEITTYRRTFGINILLILV